MVQEGCYSFPHKLSFFHVFLNVIAEVKQAWFSERQLLQVKIPVLTVPLGLWAVGRFSVSFFRGCKQESSQEREVVLWCLNSRNLEVTVNAYV